MRKARKKSMYFFLPYFLRLVCACRCVANETLQSKMFESMKSPNNKGSTTQISNVTRLLLTTALLLPLLAAQAGVVVTGLHSFQGFPIGEQPRGALIQGADGNFYGTASVGGTNAGYGTVFKITPEGMPSTLYSFTGGNDGNRPTGALVLGNDGYFYGTTFSGGASNLGTVFKLSTNGILTSLYSFSGSDGGFPIAGLVLGTDGNFYGTTYDGGTNSVGTVFKISPSGTLTSLYSFTGGNDGTRPEAGLVQANDGNFYGTTSSGGTYTNGGTVFKITANGAFSSIYSFTGGDDGGFLQSGLIQGSDNYLYGSTYGGGTNDAGTIFKMDTSGSLIGLYSFTGGDDGGYPVGDLVQGTDGNFYGTTVAGGTNHDGTVFQISATGDLTSMYSFTNGVDGANPRASLVQASSGIFYGSTVFGGLAQAGVIFEITTNGAFTSLYDFAGAADGASPGAPLVQDSSGNFYGTTVSGGTNGGNGTIFEIGTNGVLTSLYSFTGAADGGSPYGSLLLGADGNYYSTALGGGTYGAGTAFNISAAGALNSYYSFTGGADGYYPDAGLVLGNDGNFYGTTVYGGTNETGNIFEISTNGDAINLYSFTNGIDGADPQDALVLGTDGNFYGTTCYGGSTNGDGTVFRISSEGVLTAMYSFTNGVDGANPVAGLIQGTDGDFYGTTYNGGSNGNGTVFKITAEGAFTAMYSFTNGADGANPIGGLVQGTDGNFYGTASAGGTSVFFFEGGYYGGTIFKITTSGVFTALYSFAAGSDGATPAALLIQGSDGNFYGTTARGGQGNNGTVFKMSLAGPPVLQAVTLTQDTLGLAWDTVPGKTYQLQYTGVLGSTTWTNLGSPATAVGSTFSTSDFITNAVQRFYRVQVLP